MLKRSGFRRPVVARKAQPAPKRLERPVVLADCSAISRPMAKNPRGENAYLLSMAKGRPCLIRSPICNYDPETTVACHGSGVANGKGMGYKVSDAMTVWGCSACNHYTDAYGGATKEEKIAAFCAAIPAQRDEYMAIAESALSSPRDRAAALWWLENQRHPAQEEI